MGRVSVRQFQVLLLQHTAAIAVCQALPEGKLGPWIGNGLILDGQPRVLFSRQDISQALLDQPCWGVAGYSPEAARDLMGNILRHAAALRKP